MENTDVFLGLHDFLERMRKPSAGDFVKSIKSFIVSFSNNASDPEKNCGMVQEFFAKMEAAFRAHPLWSGSSEEELDSAGDGLENLLYIQRYRRESKLVGEAAYFFTNILFAESFISNIDAKSISMDESEFEKNMESARAKQ